MDPPRPHVENLQALGKLQPNGGHLGMSRIWVLVFLGPKPLEIGDSLTYVTNSPFYIIIMPFLSHFEHGHFPLAQIFECS